MGDGSELPSTLNYGQTIEWIACSIGHLASREYMVHEMHHLDSNDLNVEPALNLVATRLGWAKLDDPAPCEPTMSVAEAVWQAQKRLYDALCAGRISMTGHPNWEPANVIRVVPQLECTNLQFREDGNGLTTAAVKMNLRMFWSVIRFSNAEITREWPVAARAPSPNQLADPFGPVGDIPEIGRDHDSDMVTSDVEAHGCAEKEPVIRLEVAAIAEQAPIVAIVDTMEQIPNRRGRPPGTGNHEIDRPYVEKALKLLKDGKATSRTKAVEAVWGKTKLEDETNVTRILKRLGEAIERERKGE